MGNLIDNIQFNKVAIDSTMELVADHFNAEAVGTPLFTGASINDEVNIALGLKDPLGGPDQTITSINNGFIDEYELTITPKEQTINLRGRDQSALILDREFEKYYIFSEFVQGLNTPVLTDRVQSQIKAAQQTSILYPAGHLFQVGVFRASFIAKDIASKAGLDLIWNVRDYTFQQTFVAKGRIAASLKKLIEPWVQVEPYRADMFMQGKTIIVRPRQLPEQPLNPQYSFDVAAMRRGQIKIRRRLTKLVGRLHLSGQLTNQPGTDVTVIQNSSDTVDVTQVTIAPDPNTPPNNAQSAAATPFSPTSPPLLVSPSNFVPVQSPTGIGSPGIYQDVGAGAGGGPAGPDLGSASGFIRTVTTTTYALPQQIAIKQVKDVYAPFQVLHEEMQKDFVDSDVGPMEARSTTVTQEFDTDTGALGTSKRITKTTTYDSQNLVIGETIITELFDSSVNAWSGSIMNIKTFVDVAPGMVEIVTEEYSSQSTQGVVNQLQTSLWTLTKRDSQIAAGHRAGGGGRGGIFIPNGGTQVPIVLDKLLSTNPIAVAVDYSNPNLSLADLQYLLTLFTAQNTLQWEYEVIFQGVAMPWLQRGTVIQVTGLKGPTGATTITLPPLFISETRTTYDESRANAQYVTEVRAIGWSTS